MDNVSFGPSPDFSNGSGFLNGSDSDFDEFGYLESHLGPRYLNTPVLAVLSSVYVAIFLSGTVGNVCTCIVIARNRHMHTATNYYLFSLSVSDLATLFLGMSLILIFKSKLILLFWLFSLWYFFLHYIINLLNCNFEWHYKNLEKKLFQKSIFNMSLIYNDHKF